MAEGDAPPQDNAPIICFLCQEGEERSGFMLNAFGRFLEEVDYPGCVKCATGSMVDAELIGRMGEQDVIVVIGSEYIPNSWYEGVLAAAHYKDNVIKAPVLTNTTNTKEWGNALMAKINLIPTKAKDLLRRSEARPQKNVSRA